jgi:hypothetical protein
VQIHHDDIGSDLAYQPQRIGSVLRLADDQYALLFEQVAQPRAEQVVVIHEQDPRLDGLGVVC